MKMSNKLFSPTKKTNEELEYEKETIERIKNDHDFVEEVIRPLKLSKSDFNSCLFLFSDSQKEFNNCKNCNGLANCPNECQGFKMIPSYEFGIINKKYYPCYKYNEFKGRLDKFIYKDFSEDKDSLFLKDIKNLRNGYRQQLKLAMKDILDQKLNNWLYVYGEKNSAKTDYLIAFCNEFSYLNRGEIAFVNMDSITELVKDIFYKDKEQFEELLDNLLNVELLALDGFDDSIFMNTVIRDQFIAPILKSRSENKKITIISSNCDLDDLSYLLAMNKFGMKAADQIISYILENKHKKIYKLEHLKIA